MYLIGCAKPSSRSIITWLCDLGSSLSILGLGSKGEEQTKLQVPLSAKILLFCDYYFKCHHHFKASPQEDPPGEHDLVLCLRGFVIQSVWGHLQLLVAWTGLKGGIWNLAFSSPRDWPNARFFRLPPSPFLKWLCLRRFF